MPDAEDADDATEAAEAKKPLKHEWEESSGEAEGDQAADDAG